jgi:hypothetical protein
MSRQDKRFSKLRNLLNEDPSEDVWKKLCKEIDRCKPEDWDGIIEPWLLSHLDASWPDKLRVFPRRWLNRLEEGTCPQGASLVAMLEWQGSVSGAKLKKRYGHASFPSLRVLDFGNKEVSRRALNTAMTLPAFKTVERFILNAGNFAAAGIRDILVSDFFQQLTELSIGTIHFKENDVLEIPEDVHTDKLEALNLSCTGMTESIWLSWKQANIWGSLKKLTVGRVFFHIPYFSEEDGDWPPSLDSLELLAMSKDSLQTSGLLGSSLAQRLRHLTLSVSDAPMGKATFQLLEGLPALESLTYRWDHLRDVSLTRLEEWEHPSLKTLNMRFVNMNKKQTEALLRSPLARQLEVLELGRMDNYHKLRGWKQLQADNPDLLAL